jgi:hypothetical protein
VVFCNNNNNRPVTYQRDLAKLPQALAPLIERPRWAVWRWTQKPDGTWQKPPFMATQPERHASTTDPSTWSPYSTALAAVQTGQAEGLSYILTADDPFGAFDLDYCRDAETHSIDIWAQNFLHRWRNTYSEVTPSGTGCRIWGLAEGPSLHRKFMLEIDGKKIVVELFRRTHKALIITGYKLDTIRELTNIDKTFDWAIIWAERKAPQPESINIKPDPQPSSRPPWEDDPALNEDDNVEDHPRDDRIDDGIEDDELDEDEDDPEEPPEQSGLPKFYAHGSADPRPTTTWLVKHVIPAKGHGLLSGQWGAGKTFAVIDLAATVVTGQPFLQHIIKRQCGVLLIAAEGAGQVRLRFDAVWKEKCGNGRERAPFYWYETAPVLLQKGSVAKLVGMARQVEAQLMADFGLPLGLIIIDTLVACAGYRRSGEENDNAVGQALMNVLSAVARELDCCVLGVDHFGKDLEAGTRGAASKESSADFVLVCLGHRELSGTVTNTRLAVRKNRGGQQGQEYPFVLRPVEMGLDEDGEPETTMVVDWSSPGAAGAHAGAAPEPDPWSLCRRQEQRTAMLRLKRVLFDALAEQGVDLAIPSDGPVVRMVDQEIVRQQFYAHTPADGTPEQKGRFRRQMFLRTIDLAEQKRFVGIIDIGLITYLWLLSPNPQDEKDTGNEEPD